MIYKELYVIHFHVIRTHATIGLRSFTLTREMGHTLTHPHLNEDSNSDDAVGTGHGFGEIAVKLRIVGVNLQL